MEIIVVLAVIAVLGMILGVNVTSVAAGLLILGMITLGAMLLFFTVMTFVLMRTKRSEGELDGFERPENGFEKAMYICDTGEGSERLPNIFPAESVMREFIYRKGRTKLRLFRGKHRSFVIDRHSIAIVIFGFILTLPSLAYIIIEFSQLKE